MENRKSIVEKKIDAIKFAPPRVQLETLNKLQNAGLIDTIIGPREHEVTVLISSVYGKKTKTVIIGQRGFCGEEVQ